MPKKILKKYSPNPEKIKNMKGLGILGKWLGNPALWHFHRNSVAKAFVIGLFWMAIPVPSQMLFAAIFAILFRANLPLSVALVWISNPITMPPIFYFNYLVGTWILGTPAQEGLHFELSWQWMMTTLDHIWLPLYLGSAVVGLVLGGISYLLIQIYWRWHVTQQWHERRQRRKQVKKS
jgi:uncharacterized protein (DUF2062 family)